MYWWISQKSSCLIQCSSQHLYKCCTCTLPFGSEPDVAARQRLLMRHIQSTREVWVAVVQKESIRPRRWSSAETRRRFRTLKWDIPTRSPCFSEFSPPLTYFCLPPPSTTVAVTKPRDVLKAQQASLRKIKEGGTDSERTLRGTPRLKAATHPSVTSGRFFTAVTSTVWG